MSREFHSFVFGHCKVHTGFELQPYAAATVNAYVFQADEEEDREKGEGRREHEWERFKEHDIAVVVASPELPKGVILKSTSN
ncbi:MAG: hypothetical protein FWD17_19285, partial [Polyangiaceae bacterium]|nr:hypothetical protein [Polyangiaceae bacterium]